MLIATFVSFVSFMLIVSHAPPRWLRRMVGYKAIVDIVLHVTILWMFFGTSTEGLLQAEAAGIGFSIFLRLYRKLAGYERFNTRTLKWTRYTGVLNRGEGRPATIRVDG